MPTAAPIPFGTPSPTSGSNLGWDRINHITGQSESGNRDFYGNGSPVVSPVGARYRMQVMPETARAPGFGIAPARNNSPAEYNRVGEAYTQAMSKRYGGDLRKMWGAYNWGPGNLDRALSRHGESWLDYAPEETQKYVRGNLRQIRRR